MALEDFQKNINDPKIQVRNVSSFIPILFTLLSDSTTEVQNQAVKSFAPLVRHITDEEIVLVVSKLYEAVNKESNTSKFTTSVPNLALRSIFNDSHSRFGKNVSREIMDLLLPLLFAGGTIVYIDNIEILIDLVKNLGSVLTATELSGMITALVNGAYMESGIISKRSIIAMDYALTYVESSTSGSEQETQFYDKVFSDISNGYTHSERKSPENVCLSMYQVVLAHVKNAKNDVLTEASTSNIFNFIMGKIDLENAAEAIDVEELDIDVLVAQNLVREDSLVTLSSLMSCIPYDTFLVTYSSTVVNTIKGMIVYDPLFDRESESYSDDEYEIDFSDDEEEIEQFEDGGENDGLAAKLRLKAIMLMKHLIVQFPQFLGSIYDEDLVELLVQAISDRNDLVSSEAIGTSVLLIGKSCESAAPRSRASSDVSMTTEGNKRRTPYSLLYHEYANEFERQIFDYLLTSKNIGRFSSTKLLIESLITGVSTSLSKEFLQNLHNKLVEFRLTLKGYPDLIRLYKVLFRTYDIASLPSALLAYIIQDLKRSLADSSTYHSIIADVLVVCKLLFQLVSGEKSYEEELNHEFFEPFASKVNLKQLSSHVRQSLLSTLTSFVINISVSQENLTYAIEVFQDSLNYEVTANFTIENLILVCNEKPGLFSSLELCDLIVEKLNTYLGSSDASLYSSSLVLLDTIFKKTQYQGKSDDLLLLSSNIFELLQFTNDLNLLNKGFHILGHSLDYITVEPAYFLNLITKIINPKLADVDDMDLSSVEYLISKLTQHQASSGEDLYSVGLSSLILKNFISAKILSIITIQSNLSKHVDAAQAELVLFAQSRELAIPVEKLIFDIHYLGCLASDGKLTKITFDDFFAILNSDSHELVCLAAARALGLCIAKDLEKYLPTLLECYLSSSKDDRKKGTLILVSIKQVLKEDVHQDKSSLRFIWDSIIGVITSREGVLGHGDVSELRLAGAILSQITSLDEKQDYQSKILELLNQVPDENCNQFVVYTVVVIIKQLLSSSSDFDIAMVQQMLKFLSILNLELKQAIISTLLTGIYSKSVTLTHIVNDSILPKIYDELKAKEEFKKVIPMGPYKYVVDEGLEVRKLSYELLSSIISVDTDRIGTAESCVNQIHMFEVLLVQGLSDAESDIINLTVLNLLQLIENDEAILAKISNQHELIASLTKVINRKLRSKASTQELENYENTLRSVIRLSKVINRALTNSNALSSEWGTYYHEVKNKHHLLFATVEL